MKTLCRGIAMRAYVNDENCEGIDTPGGHARLENGDTVYVHLCSGKVIEIRPATDVRVTDEALEVLNEGDLVGSFPRASVFFAADRKMEPPSLD
jgi:hypothetical protein